ncbi:MAG: hypothetical protein ACR2P4_01400 [Gammaproteobacteria bacterium]
MHLLLVSNNVFVFHHSSEVAISANSTKQHNNFCIGVFYSPEQYANSRGVAPCYNISPLQGFNIVIPAAAVIPAQAGIWRNWANSGGGYITIAACASFASFSFSAF